MRVDQRARVADAGVAEQEDAVIGDRQREADGEEAGRAVHEVVEASLRWETQLFVDACRGDDLQDGEDDGCGGQPDLHGDDTGEEELEVGRLLDGLDRLAGKGAKRASDERQQDQRDE